jgi:AraC-like DNA-binding protein
MDVCKNFAEWQSTYDELFPGTRIALQGDPVNFHSAWSYRRWTDLVVHETVISHAIDIDFKPPTTPHGNRYHYLTLLRNGAFLTRQFGRECRAHGDIFTLSDGGSPYAATHSAQVHMLYLGLPTGLLQRSVGDLRTVCGRPISTNYGTGAILKDIVLGLWQRRDEINVREAHGIAEAIICLLSVIHGERGEEMLSHAGRRSVRQGEILDYISANLTSPDLNVESIAGVFRISSRHLRTLLSATGTTPARYIQELRLRHAMEDLTNPLLSHLSITEIAFRWGFNDLAHFSRAFHTRYREPPRKFRRKRSVAASDQ